MSANIVSKFIDNIKSEQENNKLTYINDLISLYKTLMNRVSKPLSTLDAYYVKISNLRSLGLIKGKVAELSDSEFNEMFRKSKIKVLENKMKSEPEIQDYANYINSTIKNDKLAKNLGLRFDDDIATAENTMNNYIILKKSRRQLIEAQNTQKR